MPPSRRTGLVTVVVLALAGVVAVAPSAARALTAAVVVAEPRSVGAEDGPVDDPASPAPAPTVDTLLTAASPVMTGHAGIWHAGTVAQRVEHIVRTVVEESVDAVVVTVRSWCDAASSWWEETAPRWVQRVVAQGRVVRELRETVQEVRGTVREALHLDVATG